MLRSLVSLVIGVVIFERFLFFITAYNTLLHDRSENEYFLLHACDVLDFKFIGKHAATCQSLERKLSVSIAQRAFHELIADTFFHELSVMFVLKSFAAVVFVTMLLSIQQKLTSLLYQANIHLPVTTRKLKNL